MQTLKQKRALLWNTYNGILSGIISGDENKVAEKIRKIDELLDRMERLNQRTREILYFQKA